MPNITVHNVSRENRLTDAPVFQWMEKAMESVRNRAYDLFRLRGGIPGFDVDDWLQAERELFHLPEGEMTRSGDLFNIRVTVPGFDEKNIEVTATPDEVVIHGKLKTEKKEEEKGITTETVTEKSLFRRFAFETPVDVSRVSAELTDGVLTIEAPVMTAKPVLVEKKIPVTTETAATETPTEPPKAKTAAA